MATFSRSKSLTLCMKLAWKEFLLNLPLLCMKLRVSHKWVLGDWPNWWTRPIIHCTDVIFTNYPQNCTNWALVWTYSEITRLTLIEAYIFSLFMPCEIRRICLNWITRNLTKFIIGQVWSELPSKLCTRTKAKNLHLKLGYCHVPLSLST